MRTQEPVPDLRQFTETCSEAFGFALAYGLRPIQPPLHRTANPFQAWFSDGHLSIVVTGESYGAAASVHFEVGERWVAEIYLTPPELRPPPRRDGRPEGQLQQVRAAAERVRRHCQDLLSGELARFDALAEPLPSYFRAPA